jgi:hypothetical protein
VQVDVIPPSVDDAASVEVRTSVGTVSARWYGDPGSAPGVHDVEWELDEEFRWGLNCSPATTEEPHVGQNGREVSFRGQLGLVGTASALALAHLELADAVIDLGRIEALPEGTAGSWVEVCLRPEKITVYPAQI